MAFVSSPSSTNEVNTANVQVSTANSPVSTADSLDSTANLSDATVHVFLANQPNGSQLVHEDIEQIHEYDLEEMDLKWQLALLSMSARRYFQRTGKKITINGSDTAGYDKGPRNQDNRNRNQDSSRRTVNVEETSSKAMMAIDGAGFDWSFMADEEVPTNMALMSFSDSEFNKSEFNLATYKRGLASIEEQLVFYKKNEVMFCDQIAVLKRDTSFKDSEINALKRGQISDNSKKGVGFEFQQPEFEGYGPKASMSVCKDTYNEVKKTPDAPLGEKLVSEKEKQTVYPTKIEFVHPQKKDQGYVDNGYSRHMTCNMSYLIDFKEFDGGYVTFGVGARGGRITGKGTLKTGKINFEDVYFVKELQFNLFSVSQMCDKKNSVLFTDTACFVLFPDFKLPDESQATLDESMLWHKRLSHINFKTINKLVKDNLVWGLPEKAFENDQICVACLKGKQHKASSSKDETSGILKNFITEIENLVDKKVKIIRCDNGTKFKNRVMNEFCEKKGIKREFSVARTPQQNGVAERRNRTLNETARTMLADSKLPTTFWAEALNTACYVHNRVSIVKPHNKTPYELFRGRTPALSFMRPFGCHVTILNTLDHLGKFDGKFDDGFFVGYSLTSKAFRVYNIRTRKVEENLGTNSNDFAGSEESNDAGHTSKEIKFSQDYIVMPLWKDGSMFDSSSKNSSDDEPQPSSNVEKKDDEGISKASGFSNQEKSKSSTPNINTVGPSINTASANFKTGSLNINTVSPTVITTRLNHSQNESDMFSLGRSATLEAIHADLFGDETEMDMSNLTTSYQVPTTPNTRIHKDHSLDHVIGDIQSGVQTRGMTKNTNEHGFISAVYEGKTHKDLHTYLFACFLYQEEPKQIAKALIFALVARIEAIRLFLAYASFMGFMVYQMDVKSAFLYGTIEEEVYVCQPPGFEDPDYPDKVYKVVKALYGLHQAPRAWYGTLAKYLLDNGFQRGKIDQTLFIKKQKGDIFLVQVYVDDIIFGSTNKELCTEFEKLMHDKFQISSMGELNLFLGLQVKQREDGIFISQDKYVAEILRKFVFTDVRTASTLIDTEKPLLKDSDGYDVDVHLYRSMIGSLMYLTSSRPEIMYLKGQPKLGLWYPRNSPFDLVAYSDSDYAGASLDGKSTTGGCQFLGYKLISWQCKKQTIVATSSTEAEYVAAASCYLLTKALDVGRISTVELGLIVVMYHSEAGSGNINRTQSMATLNEQSP
ncbi:putative ribonuclease H-like domain-containing protein [Tanacetum coccineum]